MNKPIIICLYGLSGSGKTTLEDKLLSSGLFNTIRAYTSRKQRPSEKSDAFYFVSKEFFIDNKELFLYYLEFNGQYYGVMSKDLLADKPTIIVSSATVIKVLKQKSDFIIYALKVDTPLFTCIYRVVNRDGFSKRILHIFKEYFLNLSITPDLSIK